MRNGPVQLSVILPTWGMKSGRRSAAAGDQSMTNSSLERGRAGRRVREREEADAVARAKEREAICV